MKSRHCKRNAPRRRGAALYLVVMSISLIVSLVGLAGMRLVRIERAAVRQQADLARASTLSQSAIELAVSRINGDSSWRNRHMNGAESAPIAFGGGTVSWNLSDSDGSLLNQDIDLQIRAIGRAGGCAQASIYRLKTTEVGPEQLQSMTTLLGQRSGDVGKGKLYCQYLKPSLPADAVEWKVTSVDLYCRMADDRKFVSVRLYKPQADNWPSTTLLDSMTISAATLSTLWQWQPFPLSGAVAINASDGICVAVVTDDGHPMDLYYLEKGVTAANSGLAQGKTSGTGLPEWTSYNTDRSLLYRLNGTYRLAGGRVLPLSGSWRRTTAP